MRTILNLIWLLFAGLWLAILYVIAGLLALLPIVTIPFSIAAFRLAGYALWPFGRIVVVRPDAGGASVIGNIVWFVLAGWWLVIGHVVTAVPLFLSIIGIPLGVANLKMAGLAIAPFGKQVVRLGDAPPSGAVHRVA